MLRSVFTRARAQIHCEPFALARARLCQHPRIFIPPQNCTISSFVRACAPRCCSFSCCCCHPCGMRIAKTCCLLLFKCVRLYRKVRSDGPPSAKLDRLYCPLFGFDTDKYGLQTPNQGLVNHLNAIFIILKVE